MTNEMSRPAYAYGVVILPPADLYRELLAIRDRHPLLRSLAPPHITVKSPFLYRQTGAIVVEQLEEICAAWEPFEIRLGGLGTFRDRVLYVKVHEDGDLSDLHWDLLEGLEGYVETLQERFEGSGYTPHLTLADKLSAEDIAEARKLLDGLSFRRRFQVDRIHLLRGKGRWEIARTFLLGAG